MEEHLFLLHQYICKIIQLKEIQFHTAKYYPQFLDLAANIVVPSRCTLPLSEACESV
jgi:hypothetical protein